MGWIVLEAAGALLLLLFVVWWTMFSGRRQGELDEAEGQAEVPTDAPADPADQAGSRGGSKKLKG
ncbi:hypothetical protein [Aquabacterium sp.]|uniref:hypothetical protein n=1 Tax=Aquabacterium sp. TaxID=1872578 RepID=UPI0025BF0F6D|nr:hypothetical protein [Aquabacterium sp.]